MKIRLFILFITCVPGWVLAQGELDYQPGKWYVGARAEIYQSRQNNARSINSSSGSVCVLVGRRLTSHFDAQLGVMIAGQPSTHEQWQVAQAGTATTPARWSQRGYVNTLVYVPATIKYIPFGSQRRWQPYLTTGLATTVGTMQAVEFTVDNPSNRTVTERSGQVSVNLLVGLGLQVRVVNRLHMAMELSGGKSIYQAGSVGSVSLGLVYDLRSK